MGLISRYIFKAHIGPFVFGTATVTFLFLFQFLMRYLEQLIGKGLDWWVISQLICLNLAWMVVLAVPMGVLFSTLMAFGSMSAASEITVIKSSGASLLRMMAPVIITGCILTYALYVFNDKILPEANHQQKVLTADIKRKKPTFAIEAGQFSMGLEGFTILARQLDTASGAMKNVTIYNNSGASVSNIINADSGFVEFTPDGAKLLVTMYKGEIHQYRQSRVNGYKLIDFNKYKIYIDASGFNLEKTNANLVSRSDREMSIDDMQQVVDDADHRANTLKNNIQDQVNKHFDFLAGKSAETATNSRGAVNNSQREALDIAGKRIAGLSAILSSDLMQINEYNLQMKKYRVEIYKKYSIPFACLLFVFVGCPLGIITRNGNFGISAVISLGFYILYWACLIGGEKLADRALLNPALAMWMGNIIIGVLGLFLTIKVNFETFKVFDILKIFSKGKKK